MGGLAHPKNPHDYTLHDTELIKKTYRKSRLYATSLRREMEFGIEQLEVLGVAEFLSRSSLCE